MKEEKERIKEVELSDDSGPVISELEPQRTSFNPQSPVSSVEVPSSTPLI